MGRGPSVVARPEQRGQWGWGVRSSLKRSLCPPHSSQSGAPPTAGAGVVPALGYWGFIFS